MDKLLIAFEEKVDLTGAVNFSWALLVTTSYYITVRITFTCIL